MRWHACMGIIKFDQSDKKKSNRFRKFKIKSSTSTFRTIKKYIFFISFYCQKKYQVN